MMAIIQLLGGFRATAFAAGLLVLGALYAWDHAVTIPHLRGALSEAQGDLAMAEAQRDKAVNAANSNAAELKRLTEDAAAETSRAEKARMDAEAKARLSNAQLETLRKELANAKAADDAVPAPALRAVIDGLRRSP